MKNLDVKSTGRWLLVLGAINWGLIGLFDSQVDIIRYFLADYPKLIQFLYILIGVAGVNALLALIRGENKI